VGQRACVEIRWRESKREKESRAGGGGSRWVLVWEWLRWEGPSLQCGMASRSNGGLQAPNVGAKSEAAWWELMMMREAPAIWLVGGCSQAFKVQRSGGRRPSEAQNQGCAAALETSVGLQVFALLRCSRGEVELLPRKSAQRRNGLLLDVVGGYGDGCCCCLLLSLLLCIFSGREGAK
jgi:hypothetical protein